MQGARVFQCPTRYLQKSGLVSHVGDVVAQTYAKVERPGLVISPRSLASPAGQKLVASFPKEPEVFQYDMECCRRGVDAVAAAFQQSQVDYVVSFGGGKIIDTGKLVADMLDARSIVMPSIASNDSPCTALSVLYTEEGAFDEYVFFRKSPDIVLVDTDVILESPPRFLVAGMGDALSTYYEARAVHRNTAAPSLISPFIYRPTTMAVSISKQCRDILFEHGQAAAHSAQVKQMDASFEEVIEANILMSGLGAESAGLAAAHALHNAISELPEAHKKLHGEKVAFGTLAQLMLENDQDEAMRVAQFCNQVGLPTTFKDLGVDIDDEKLDIIANHAMDRTSTLWNMGPHMTHQLVKDALMSADSLGRYLHGQVAAEEKEKVKVGAGMA